VRGGRGIFRHFNTTAEGAMPKDRIDHVAVATQADLKRKVLAYLDDGFKLSSESAELATLEKPLKPLKFIDFVLLLLGILACVIPGVLFAWWRIPQLQNKQRIVVRVDAAAANASGASAITWSDDGKWWWDGQGWRDPTEAVPTGAQWSDDGAHWWDGQSWRPAPTMVEATASTETTTLSPDPSTATSPTVSAHPNGDQPEHVVDQ